MATSCERLATATEVATSLNSLSSAFSSFLQTFVNFKMDANEEVGPAPDITGILALLEQYQAPRHGPGLPGGDATVDEVAYAARHFPPGGWELLRPGPFPTGPRDRPPTPMPSASVSYITNAAEVAEDKVVALASTESGPRKRRRCCSVRSLVRGFRWLFSRNRKPTASS